MKTINYLVLCFCVVSCSKELKTETITPSSLIIGDPLECGIENILIFPIGTSYTAKVFEKEKDLRTSNYLYFSKNKSTLNDRFADIEYVNEKEDDFDIRNILFYDLLKGTSYQMVSDTIHILSFAIHKEFTKPLIFYRIIKQDFNDDKKFNSLDPVMLYISDLDGKNLIQITSINEYFIDYNYYPKTEKILIKTIIDSDKNKEFSISDETNFVEMNVISPAYGKEIFSKSLKDSLRVQINLN